MARQSLIICNSNPQKQFRLVTPYDVSWLVSCGGEGGSHCSEVALQMIAKDSYWKPAHDRMDFTPSLGCRIMKGCLVGRNIAVAHSGVGTDSSSGSDLQKGV